MIVKNIAIFRLVLTLFFMGVVAITVGQSIETEQITTTGVSTWTCPANVTTITVTAWGGGGGGGGSNGSNQDGGGGGGGGGISRENTITVIPGTIYNITVGAGGAGGTQGVMGGTGGSSIAVFGVTTVTAFGGAGGEFQNVAVTGGAGGAGGVGNLFNGGSGGQGTANDGGGGGESGCTTGNGNNGTTFAAGSGCDGGDGGAANPARDANGAPGNIATGPGGGGGAATQALTGGVGSRGQINIEYEVPGCGTGGGELAIITANTYNSICPATSEVITFTITESANGDIPSGATGNIVFILPYATDFKFLDNANLTVSWNTSGDLDVGNNLISSPSVSLTDDYTIDVYNLATRGGGGGQNQNDYITVTVEVLGVNLGSDVVERCGGTFTTQFIDDGTNVANINSVVMSYVTTVVSQNETSDVPPNSINNEIMTFNVSTTGACSAINATQFIWETTGSTDETDISKATIFYTGSSSVFSGIGTFATAATPIGSVTMTGSQTLVEGDNYFWLAYDLPISAVAGDVIDAASTSITVDGTAYDITSVTPNSRNIGAFFTSGVDDVWSNGGVTWNLTSCADVASAGTPGAGSNAYICDGRIVTLTADAAIKNIVVDGTLNLNGFDLVISESLTLVSGVINSTGGNLIFTGANKIIFGDGSINFTTGNVVIQENTEIDAAANITVTGTQIILDVDNKTLTNKGILTTLGFTSSGSTSGRIFRNASNSLLTFTGASGWNNKLTCHFDDAVNTVNFAATHTIVTSTMIDNSTFWHVKVTGGTLTIPANAFIVKGDFTNNSTVAANAGSTITFSGASAQVITGTSATAFGNLVINNANGVTLGNNVSAATSLALTSGVVTTGTNIMTLSSATAANLTSSGGYVYGKLSRGIASNTDTYAFYVAKGTASTDEFRLDFINGNITGTTNITVSVGSITEIAPNDDATLAGAGISEDGTTFTEASSEKAEWSILANVARTGGTFGLNLYTGNITPVLEDNKFAILKRPSASVSYADWLSEDATTVIPAFGLAGRLAAGYAQKTGFTTLPTNGFKFGIGSAPGVLPIELLSFEANVNGDQVDLKWATAAEINNDYFTVEKSINGKDFTEAFKVEGAGNSNYLIEYYDVDYDVWGGKTYYRLKQTDYDGKFSYSNIVAITFKGENSATSPGELEMNIYPNPSDGTNIHIAFRGFDPDVEILVIVRDITGKEFYAKVLMLDYNDEVAIVIDPYDKLPAGTYLITGSSENRLFSKKLIVKN